MSNKVSNYPSNQLNNMPAGVCAETVSCLRDLADRGKPQTVTELRQRIDDYFQFCAEHDIRCGIESLCLALSISRTTLFNWCNENGCSKEWAEECQRAKQFVLTFIEQVSLSGRLNPATSIFVLKNWGNYKDSISFEESTPKETQRRALTASELPKLSTSDAENEESNERVILPRLD